MSGTQAVDSAESKRIIEKLDTLIDAMLEQIESEVSKHTKLGDLIRMIHLRYKLMPDHSSQKEFWKMVEKIRQEKLPAAPPEDSARAIRTERKKAST